MRQLQLIMLFLLLLSLKTKADSLPQIEVGPFCSSEPYGVTIIADRGAAWVIAPNVDLTDTWAKPQDEALLPYPTASPDGTFVTASWTSDGKPFTITYGRVDNTSVGIVLSADEEMDLTLRWRQPFSTCKTLFWEENGKLNSVGIDALTGRSWKLYVSTSPQMTIVDSSYRQETQTVCHLSPDQPSVIIISIGEQNIYTSSYIQDKLSESEQQYFATRIQSEGDWGNFVGAIAKTMNGSRLFSSLDRRLVHCIGRGWWIASQSTCSAEFVGSDDDQFAYFAWDSFFNANLASLEDPTTAHETVRAILSVQMEDGMVPNYAHWPCQQQYITPHKTNPPVGALCVWKIHQRHPDITFLQEVYPKLVLWHDWFRKGRCHEGSYLLSWGHARNIFSEAVLETGWDNTPSFDGGEMSDGLMNLYCVDLCSLWAMDAEYLALIADDLGEADDAMRFRQEHERMVKEMNNKLWNDTLGLYCNRFCEDNADGTPHFLTRVTLLNFYPLICGAPSKEQARRMLAILHDTGKFWGEYLLPSLPYDDVDYPGHYWRGYTWGPANYLLWQGLLRYDDEPHLKEFVTRSVRLFMRNWDTPMQCCGENYRSDNCEDAGNVGDDPHYTWGALLPLIGVEALLNINEEMAPTPSPLSFTEELTLRHIPIGGQLYTVESHDGRTSITKE